ncbi:MAG TPA: ribosome maturation factor RimP [Candidatus Dormibacteraeota bacterium]|nr:ribosome maturation factor RimP [Candidatus Dormibacteraeota bacterium]
MPSDDVLAPIRELVRPSLEQSGVELFDVRFTGSGGQRILRLTIDKENGVTLEDCERVSSAVAAVLDAYDPIEGAYSLEVSSPGAERPIRDTTDWRRNVGRLVNVRFATGEGDAAGETIVEGRLLAVGADDVEIEVRERRRVVPTRIPLASVRAARQAIDI